MPTFKVIAKWKGQKFDVNINTDESPSILKEYVKEKTGIPTDRQKIFISGVVLGDESYTGIKLKEGCHIMIMGTVEDLPESILSRSPPPPEPSASSDTPLPVSEKLPVGLINFGNTCYMNSAVQLLYAVPEFRTPVTALQKFSNEKRDVFTAIRLIFTGFGTAQSAIMPITLIQAFGKAYSQFGAQTNIFGAAVESREQVLEQQDANECFLVFLHLLEKLQTDASVFKDHPTPVPESFGNDCGWNPVDRFLRGRLENTLTNEDDKNEPELNTVEDFLQLSCYITQEIKFLHTGLKNSLESKLQKKSESSGQEMTYKKVSRYSRLPAYLSIQIARFFYKEKSKCNAKILKDIKFPMTLDLYEDCTDELKTKLTPYREAMDKMDEKEKNEVKKRGKEAIQKPPNPDDNPELYEPYWLPDDLGSNNTGRYQLLAVLTHKGRGNGGHYATWVKRSGVWYMIDDSNVTSVEEEDILKLSGGGEYHSAYILLYGPARYKKPQLEEEKLEAEASTTAEK